MFGPPGAGRKIRWPRKAVRPYLLADPHGHVSLRCSSSFHVSLRSRWWPGPPPLPGQVSVASPDGRNQVTVEIREGRLSYSLARDGRALILPSAARLRVPGRAAAPRRPPHHRHHPAVARRMVDPALGRSGAGARPPQRAGRLRGGDGGARAGDSPSGSAPSTTASASATSSPSSPASASFEITDELTEFALADNARAWWIPSNWARKDRSEMLYSSGPVSVLDSVQTPLTMETQDGRTFMVIHEANLVDYARMFLPGHAHGEPDCSRRPWRRWPTASRCAAAPRS